jgi:hypothetical protein
VTYTAVLNRMIELAKMVQHPMLAELTRRHELNLQRIERLLTSGPESTIAGKPLSYFVMSCEPEPAGVLHGKYGHAEHGYFEASPNHDVAFLRVVNDSVAEDIMQFTDPLAVEIPRWINTPRRICRPSLVEHC